LALIKGFVELSTGKTPRDVRFNRFLRRASEGVRGHADSAEGAGEEKVGAPVGSRSTQTVFAGFIRPAMISLLRGDSISRPTARRRGLAP
jgi:hypothetical protein